MLLSAPLKNHPFRRLRRSFVPVLVLAAFWLPACRSGAKSGPVAFCFIDGLTNAGVVDSPLKSPETGGAAGKAFPVNSVAMVEESSGEAAFGLKRKLNLGVMDINVLFAPPRSELRYPLPYQQAGIIDLGIAIVRDANSAARNVSAENHSGGVKFLLVLEQQGRKKVIFEHFLQSPVIRTARTISYSRQRIPIPALKDGATLTFITSGDPDAFALWVNPVYYVPEKAPRNFILISIDTLRADHVGTYGYDRPTSPHIAALAADGAVFESSYSTAPWTLPAHVSMLTGLNCVRHRVYYEHDRMNPRLVTLAEKMRENGYATRAVSSGGFVSALYGFSKGFDEYRMDQGDITDETQAAKTGRDAVQWIEKNTDRSFFLFIHTYQVHSPYKNPEPYRSMFLRPDAKWKQFDVIRDLGGRPGIFNRLSESERDNLIGLYDGGIRYTDEALIKPVVDALRRSGLYDRTMIIVTADHGEEFYDHGGWSHSHTVYDEIIHVPLIIKMPGSEFRGRRYSSIVRLVDIMPTVLDVAGIPFGKLSLNGESLRSVLKGKETGDRRFLAELADNIVNIQIPGRLALNDGRSKVILNQPYTPEEMKFFFTAPPTTLPVELFDLKADPREQRNIVDRPETAAKARLLIEKARETVRLIPQRQKLASKIDKNLEDQLRALGYIK